LTFKKTGLSQDQINDIQHTRAANQKTTWIEMFNICCRDRQTPAPAPTNEVIFIRTPWPVDFVASILPKFLELEMDPTLDQLMATANSSDDRKVAFRNIIESLLLQRVPTYLEDNLGQSRRRTRQAQALMAQDGQGAPPVVFGYSHVHPKSGFVQDPPRMAGGSSTHVVGLRSPMMVNGYGDFPVDGGGHSMQFADFPPMNNSTALPFGWNPHAFSPTNPIAHPAAQNGLATMASSPSAPLHDTLSQCPWQYNPKLAFSKNSQGPMSPNAVYNTDLSQGLPANTHQPALHYGMAASSPVSKSNQQYPLGPRHFGNPL
jgi:hypothetical protein